jgi:glycerophosphoryl diester phosphodiesterase
MHRVLELGVDGVFTDDSELFVEVRADRLRALGYID